MGKKKGKLTADLALLHELEGSASQVNLDGKSSAKVPEKIVTGENGIKSKD